MGTIARFVAMTVEERIAKVENVYKKENRLAGYRLLRHYQNRPIQNLPSVREIHDKIDERRQKKKKQVKISKRFELG